MVCVRSCDKCLSPAVWEYAPSDGERYFCDECVPRGCSCNAEYNQETGDWDGPEKTDEDGRLRPCCEYWFWDDGVPA